MVQDQDACSLFPQGCMDVKDCFENLLKCGCHTVWIISKGAEDGFPFNLF